MSVAVLPSCSPSPFRPENYLCWAPEPAPEQRKINENNEEEEDRPGQLDIWTAIQSHKAGGSGGAATAVPSPAAPYVHPLLRRSSSLLSQKSLEVCTESLGSETGSADFSSFLDDLDFYNSARIEKEEKMADECMHEKQEAATAEEDGHISGEVVPYKHNGKEMTLVNYHCSISKRSQPRSFPPPLPSISRRDGPCLHMRPHRCGGRLVVEAVPVPSQNYLHAQREPGRLLLSFVDANYNDPTQEQENTLLEEEIEEEKGQVPEESEALQVASEEIDEIEEKYNCNVEEEEEDDEEEEMEEEEEEEEVEVVDRGTVVEVKVSTQPQQQSSAAKVLRSSVVINKFVGDTPVVSSTTVEPEQLAEKNEIKSTNIAFNAATTALVAAPTRRAVPITTTTAAAVVAASTLSVSADGCSDYCHGYGTARAAFGGSGGGGGQQQPPDNKLLFTSKRRNRQELLHNMRRCSQLRRPLFIWEPYCIATS